MQTIGRGRTALLVGILALVAIAGVAIAITREPQPTSLAAYLAHDDGADQGSRRQRQDAAVQRLTAQCMAARDLPYQEVAAPGEAPKDAELSPVDWAMKWGFGVSTADELGAPLGSVDDPNLEYAANLSQADRTAYIEALHGAPGTELRGCAGWASDEVFNLTDELLIEYHLIEPLQAMNREIAADVRVVEARRDWRSCVEPLGFPANDPGPYTVGVLAEFQARTGAVLSQPDHDALLEKLKAEERRVATEVARCGATLSAATTVITSEYEARFVETHRSDLEEVRRRLEYFEQLLPSVPPTPQPASRSETGRPNMHEAPFASSLAYAVGDRPVVSPI